MSNDRLIAIADDLHANIEHTIDAGIRRERGTPGPNRPRDHSGNIIWELNPQNPREETIIEYVNVVEGIPPTEEQTAAWRCGVIDQFLNIFTPPGHELSSSVGAQHHSRFPVVVETVTSDQSTVVDAPGAAI